MNPDNPTTNVYLRWYKQPMVMVLILLLCFISLISYTSYREVTALQVKLTQAAEIPLKRIQHLDSLFHHLRKRQILLSKIINTDDPFEQDDLILEHQKLAPQFLQERNELEKLLTTEKSRNILQNIKQQNGSGYSTQLEIIDLAVSGQTKIASKMVRENMSPRFENIFPLLLNLRNLLIVQSKHTANTSQIHASKTTRQILQLYVITIVIGVFLVLLAYQVQRKHHKALIWQASHDALTGLINRHEFEYSLDKLTQGSGSHGACALLYIDLDQFKLINDTAGHNAGDELLRQIAGLLSAKLDSTTLLARLGGDEFAILAADTNKEDIEALAMQVLRILSSFRFVWTDQTFNITASIGLVLFKNQKMSKEELFTAADLACHTAKDRGRNCFHTYTPSDVETRSRLNEMHLATKLREAISDDKLKLFHQPIVRADNHGSFHRTEILLRYIENDGRPIGPFKMILAAEKFGFANTLDEYVVNKVLKHMKASPANDMIYNINLSGQSLESNRTLNRIVDMIDDYHINPDQICFEITETNAITRFTNAQKFINTLQGMGCVFALDDFGSGVSSFGHLDKLPVDMIKIDASFVQNLHIDESSRAIVIAIREVARAFGIKVVAEGVENDMIREQVKQLNIDYAQGFGIAMPEPLDKRIA